MRVIYRNGSVYEYRCVYHAAISDPKYALPNLKKYPLPDRAHVKSAIRFFNYVSPRYEKILAYAILKRMDEYGMSFDDMTIGDENRFKKYIPKSDYLEHHGILGMHWGRLNGPPYPLGASDHSASEKKAGWRKSLDSNEHSDSKSSKKAKKENADKKSKSGFNKKKALKIGIGIAATALVAVGAYQMYKHGMFDKLLAKGKGIAGSLNKDKDLADFTIDNKEALSKINPNFSEGLKYQMNCGNCTIANELAKRGVEGVSAGPNAGGMTIEQMKSYFKLGPNNVYTASDGMNIKDINDYPGFSYSNMYKIAKKRSRDVANALSKNITSRFPAGSRGNIMVPTKMGSHWISWQVRPNGTVNFENPQDPSFDLKTFFANYKHPGSNMPEAHLTILRLDNADFDMSRSHEVVNTATRSAEIFNTFKRR